MFEAAVSLHRHICTIILNVQNFAKKYGLTQNKICDFKIEFFGEFESIFRKALTRMSGAQMELFDEKKPEAENPPEGGK
jgi:hypothetical protein